LDKFDIEMHAVICTDGDVTANQLINECAKEQWIPVFAYYEDDVPVIVTFEFASMAKKFIDRNFPREWTKGTLSFSQNDIRNILDKGWKIDKLNWPKKLLGKPGLRTGFEIIELNEQPLLYALPT